MNLENCHQFVTLPLHSGRSLQHDLCNEGGDEAQPGKTSLERLGEGKMDTEPSAAVGTHLVRLSAERTALVSASNRTGVMAGADCDILDRY